MAGTASPGGCSGPPDSQVESQGQPRVVVSGHAGPRRMDLITFRYWGCSQFPGEQVEACLRQWQKVSFLSHSRSHWGGEEALFRAGSVAGEASSDSTLQKGQWQWEARQPGPWPPGWTMVTSLQVAPLGQSLLGQRSCPRVAGPVMASVPHRRERWPEASCGLGEPFHEGLAARRCSVGSLTEK